MHFKMTRVSGNRKTGPMPTIMADGETCPKTCPFFGCCYGKRFPLCLHWTRLMEGNGYGFEDLLWEVSGLPAGIPFRYAVVGDLPGVGNRINPVQLLNLATANKSRNKKGFTFTHKVLLKTSKRAAINRDIILKVNGGTDGFTINLSSEGIRKADRLYSLGIGPVATVLPSTMGDWRTMRTPNGERIIRCHAEYRKDVQCVNCGGSKGPMCSWTDREFIMGFTAHGAFRKTDAVIAAVEKELKDD